MLMLMLLQREMVFACHHHFNEFGSVFSQLFLAMSGDMHIMGCMQILNFKTKKEIEWKNFKLK